MCPGTLAECSSDDGGKFVFPFHSGKETLGRLLGAAEASLVGFDGVDPLTDFAAHVFGEAVEPRAQAGLFIEKDGEFIREFGGAGIEVSGEREFGFIAEVDTGALLHGAADEEIVAAGSCGGRFSGEWEERGAEGKGAARVG